MRQRILYNRLAFAAIASLAFTVAACDRKQGAPLPQLKGWASEANPKLDTTDVQKLLTGKWHLTFWPAKTPLQIPMEIDLRSDGMAVLSSSATDYLFDDEHRTRLHRAAGKTTPDTLGWAYDGMTTGTIDFWTWARRQHLHTPVTLESGEFYSSNLFNVSNDSLELNGRKLIITYRFARQ